MKAVLRLAALSAWSRRLTLGLSLLAIALAVTLLLAVERIRGDARQSFTQSVSGVDLVVGARTGSVQLMLYAVFHAGAASKTATLKHLVTLPAPLRAGDLGLAHHVLQPSEEVVDPGGGEVDVFIECAREVVTLVRALAPLL